MKILHINLGDSEGGAAKAALRLHRGMLRRGVSSRLLVIRRRITGDETILIPGFLDVIFWSKVRYLVGRWLARKSVKNRGLFSYPFGAAPVAGSAAVAQADVIYLHWINHGLLNLAEISRLLALGKPVVWVCHDMWPVTGGCHHALDCPRFHSHCGECPSLENASRSDLSVRLFRKKQQVYSRFDNLTFVSISPFMDEMIRTSALSSDKPRVMISNALDCTIFQPMDKAVACRSFGLDPAKRYVLFGADMGVKNRYKGWDYARRAFEILFDKQTDGVEVIIFGSKYDEQVASSIPFPATFLGKISEENKMAQLYNCADVYLNPSIAESLSYTTMESLACGVPVVGFDVGGIPYLVSHKTTGYLAPLGSAEELSEGVLWTLSHLCDSLKEQCRKSVTNRFDIDIITAAHLDFLARMQK